MFKLDKARRNSYFYKLVIINENELDKRFSQREHIHKYIRSLDYISYNHLKDRTIYKEEFKYYDVKMYNKYIKYSDDTEIFFPFSQTQVQQAEQRITELTNKYNEDEYWTKYTSEERKNFNTEKSILNELIITQRIISNPDYFTEIKRAGIYFIESEVKCNQYPEKVFLNDLINSENNIKIISEEYYNKIKSDWNNSLKKF